MPDLELVPEGPTDFHGRHALSPTSGAVCCTCDWGGFWRSDPTDDIESHAELIAKLEAATASPAAMFELIDTATMWEDVRNPGEGGIPPWVWPRFITMHSFTDAVLVGRVVGYVRHARIHYKGWQELSVEVRAEVDSSECE